MTTESAPQIQELQVDKTDLRRTQLVSRDVPTLQEGEVLLRVDRFALTANNVTYAVAGDQIGYWKFFPAGGGDGDPTWGVVPVWGLADVVDSRCNDVPVGERLYGYLPMASHVVLSPGKVRPRSLIDAAEHRSQLPPVYNSYSRVRAEPQALQAIENERCLFFPLFMTSYFLYDYLEDNAGFGADQVLLGSASSKTAFGLAYLLDQSSKLEVAGLTSPGNVGFVKALGTYNKTATYGDMSSLDPERSTVFVDMAGSTEVTRSVHEHFGDQLQASISVGATHWETDRSPVELPGPRPEFFFAPGQIQKRDAQWGPGVALAKAGEACVGVVHHALQHLTVSHRHGPEAVQNALLSLLANDVPPSHGLMVSMHQPPD